MKPVRASAFADAAPVDGRLLTLDERDALLIEIARRFYPGVRRDAARS